MYALFKAIISALLIAIASEAGKRSALVGALVASLPLVSLLAMGWLWIDTRDPDRLAAFAETTFWYVLPSLPMFLLIGAMLRHGVSFWVALGVGALVTLSLYAVTTLLLGVFHPGQ